ncbi:YkvA family protein [Marinobacter sp. TBZ242]|uniref:YkvA family protein n=1 Tax=Marinobacter azerbaijanicus TaxID=3050455 RepID=A0ABT7ICK3_9GAMM|nr:YkvA family protein [Marinobacter sp. TBZ242]MDL0431882.1 YkvA family protein [Marinobacter sp. TBZ242]
MATFSDRKANEQLKTEASKVHGDDVADLLARQKAIEDKVRNSGKLRRFGTDIRLMFAMLRDYWQGNYRNVPWKSIAAIAGALIYVLNPLDLIPDVLLGIGFLDDAGVVAACLAMVESDLIRYAAWKDHETATQTPTNSD